MGIKSPPKLQSRLAALNILQAVYQGTSLKHALDHANFTELPISSRGYARFLVTHTIRYQRLFQQIMMQFLTKKPQKKSADFVNSLLTLGICELLISEQKPNITLSSFVDMAKNDKKNSHLSGMIRAILGKVLADKEHLQTLLTDYPTIFGNELYDQLKADYSDETDDICQRLLSEPNTDILKLTDCPTPDGYHDLSPICARLTPDGVRPEKLDLFTDGKITIQSFASHTALYCAGDIAGKTLIDLCAAPGGKTLQAISNGATVTAVDISKKRLEKLQENLKRTKLKASVMSLDALDLNSDKKFDIVLLDAPCSATGTISKNPDIILKYNISNYTSLSTLQKNLLDKAKNIINEGGLLIYAVCSLAKSEGELQIQNFIKNNPEFSITNPLRTDILPKEALTPDGFIRLLPHHDQKNAGHDGFFVAYLRKSETG